ncbi:MAG: hypothetical protein D6719_09050 [Candidatus Dadabacteria bacterium]|nr:MAG: hypothetical protein D6719_09050 [Candidatus Dadabacteria bacterium]
MYDLLNQLGGKIMREINSFSKSLDNLLNGLISSFERTASARGIDSIRADKLDDLPAGGDQIFGGKKRLYEPTGNKSEAARE